MVGLVIAVVFVTGMKVTGAGNHLGAGERGDEDGCCPGVEQGAGAGAGGGAGGDDVVDEQNGAIPDLSGARDVEGEFEIEAALIEVERDLGRGFALADERCGRERELPAGIGAAQGAQRGVAEQASLIEAARAAAARMERDGDDEHLARGHRGERLDGLCEQRAERTGQRADAVELERVDGEAQLAAVRGEAGDADEGLREVRAGVALVGNGDCLFRGCGNERGIGEQRGTAAGAGEVGASGCADRGPAGRTDGSEGGFEEPVLAEAAAGGAERGDEGAAEGGDEGLARGAKES